MGLNARLSSRSGGSSPYDGVRVWRNIHPARAIAARGVLRRVAVKFVKRGVPSAAILSGDVWVGSADFGVLALPVFNSLTINGNGHPIDAQSQSRIFFIGVDEAMRASAAVAGSIIAQRPQVTLNDLTLVNGRAEGGGSAVGGGGMGASGALFADASAMP